MLVFHISNYLTGAVKLRVSGNMPERFINLCMANEIYIWQISAHSECIEAWIRLPDFFRIRKLVKISGCRVTVVTYYGLPFIIKKIKSRKMLVAGAVLFIVALQILSSYIWFVDVVGTKELNPEQIKVIASGHGLMVGHMKKEVDLKNIETKMLLEVPQAAWIGISFTGTRAVIEVVEKTLPKQESKKPANLVACKDGVITEIITLAGQPLVKKGDTVRKGDILIKGEQIEPVKARGIIKAQVWYESYGESKLVDRRVWKTGNKNTYISVNYNSKEYVFLGKENTYSAYEQEEIYKNFPIWRNSNHNVEINMIVYNELAQQVTEKPYNQALAEAKQKALAAVEKFIPQSAEVLSRHTEVLYTGEQDLIRVKLSMETIEDIANAVQIEH